MKTLHEIFWLLITYLCWHRVQCMNLVCDEVKYNFCKINIDGGHNLNVALISEENNLTNSSEESYEINFTIVPVDRYDDIIEQLNIAYEYENETWTDDLPREFYENPENVQKIQLEFQSLTKIKSSAFSGALNLIEIDLDHNQILYISADAFSELNNLTVLSLTKNNLTIIRANTFAGAINLRRLHLNQNKIEHIEDGALNLPNLENILLQNNRLKKLSSSLFIGTPRLKEAVFEENELMQINEAFTHLHGLEVLILDYNEIDDINLIKFAHLAELNHLSLRKSGFQLNDKVKFDENENKINSSSKLEVLDLAENGLTNGEELITQLRLFQRLEIINLEYNEIASLGDVYKIKKWYPYLQILNLSYNPVHCSWIENYVSYLSKRDLKVYPWLNSRNGCIPDEEI
ncbi:protein artichoke-like [Contarinia nasturtii]|uniref:protein artichoke-like n=1 Tax=Contarinia nasturtii TaxID=265458 RepID=UPI0012D405BD|nr:protein artichoke-like [Contarinia nasturtii]